eukprot:7363683-Pyramimonas_sp.AAC.2
MKNCNEESLSRLIVQYHFKALKRVLAIHNHTANGVQITTVTHLDVVTAYLNADLKDEVYIRSPGNFDGKSYARLTKSTVWLCIAMKNEAHCSL